MARFDCFCGYSLILLVWGTVASGFNITTFFWNYPEFETFNNLLTASNVAREINNRTSLTILALSNSVMEPFFASFGGNPPASEISYVLQYHVLLEYLDWDRLRQMTNGGTLVATLYQTTGRASNNFGAVNVSTRDDGKIGISAPVHSDNGSFGATINRLVKAFPYTISIFSISTVLVPYGFDMSATCAPNDIGINVTDVLLNAKNFNFVVSMMLASGITAQFQSDQAGAGITIFAPTDDAFSALPPDTLQGLTAERKAVVLRYHVLHCYYPLGSLESIVNPVQPTLATEQMGAGTYTLNITRIHGMVTVDTGFVQASVTQTVFDQKPLAIFAVPKVLLPREMFGTRSPVEPPQKPSSPNVIVFVPSPAPESSPLLAVPPRSPPTSRPFSAVPSSAPPFGGLMEKSPLPSSTHHHQTSGVSATFMTVRFDSAVQYICIIVPWLSILL